MIWRAQPGAARQGEAIDAQRRVVLDMDSTEVRVHGAADAGRHLAADQPAAAVGQDRRTFDPARALLLVLLAESHLTRP
jgi:hypothetical protein